MKVNTRSMVYVPVEKTLIAEASMLGFLPGCWPGFLEVESHHTGRVVTFWATEESNEAATVYRPSIHERVSRVKLTVLNT